MGGRRVWRAPEGERERELRLQMVQYVEGYILACNDALKDLDEVWVLGGHGDEVVKFKDQMRGKVQASLRQARQSLRLWKGLSTDEQGDTDATSDGVRG